MVKKYRIRLSEQERLSLEDIIGKGKVAAYKRRHAHILVLDGEGEARLVAVACGSAPEGQARWTLRLLADRLVELEVVESISRETVSKVLKKMNLSPGRASAGASLPGKARNSSAPWRTC